MIRLKNIPRDHADPILDGIGESLLLELERSLPGSHTMNVIHNDPGHPAGAGRISLDHLSTDVIPSGGSLDPLDLRASISRSISQTISQTISRSISQTISRTISRSIPQTIPRPTSQPVLQPFSQTESRTTSGRNSKRRSGKEGSSVNDGRAQHDPPSSRKVSHQ